MGGNEKTKNCFRNQLNKYFNNPERESRWIKSTLDKYLDNPIEQVHLKSGKSRPTVSRLLKGGKVRPSSAETICIACFQLIEEKSGTQIIDVKHSDDQEDTSQISMNL